MEYKAFVIGFCLVLLCMPAVSQAASQGIERLPGIEQQMLQADFWIARAASPQQIIMTPQQIELFNKSIIAAMPQVVVDMYALPDSLDKNALKQRLAADKLPRGKERYSGGSTVAAGFYDQLEQNMNLAAISESNPTTWGYTVRRTDLRTFPTDRPSSEDEESDDFDIFQETAVNIAEPVAVLHRSSDARWLFVQLYNYRGWLRAADVALSASRQEWQARQSGASFIVITGSRVVPREAVMGKPIADWRAGMGTRLPYLGPDSEGYAVEIPQRSSSGAVVWRKAWIHGKADVAVGFLPYTRAAIIRQAFKMQGESYGWGGLHEGRDCSSFIADIFTVFGFHPPRNADQQERTPGRSVDLRTVTNAAARYSLLSKQAEPGATLHMRNHVMLYLGQNGDKYYAIHDLGSYGDDSAPRSDGSLPRVEVMKVVVSELDLPLRSGRHFIEALSSANVWHP